MRTYLQTSFQLWPLFGSLRSLQSFRFLRFFRLSRVSPLFKYSPYISNKVVKDRRYLSYEVKKIHMPSWDFIQPIPVPYRYGANYGEVLSSEGKLIELMRLSMGGHDFDVERSFVKSCRWGHLVVAKWLRMRYFISKETVRKAFYRSCTHGHLLVAKWLYPDLTATDLRYGFLKACMAGQLEIVTWLIDQMPMDYLAFRLATKHGHYEIVRLMLATWPQLDRHNCNDFALKVAMKYGYYNIIDLLKY